MNQEKRQQAIKWAADFLPKNVKDYPQLVQAIKADDDWNMKNRVHFEWGMWFRNQMRKSGFGEQTLEVDNIDDYYGDIATEAVLGYPRPSKTKTEVIDKGDGILEVKMWREE